ncbi:hypothetical protein [Inediibacterium massiliense]|uniref:hypothetical protein n=1 Tax=Inediibacterium massiliense TaxID=1658111 RepID=UPI0006B5FA35|nr:hypothetical protein [Inediibacterium massiliense]
MTIQWYNPKVGASIVSIATYGITFSSGAIETLGNPKYIKLGFDEQKKYIVVQPCDASEQSKFEFASKNRKGYIRISNKDFIRFIQSKLDDNIKIEDTASKYIGKWDKEYEYLYICLDEPLDKKIRDDSNDSDDE